MHVRDALCALLDHSRNRRVFASVALVAFLLTGCSTNASWLVDSGHYSAYHCDALPGQLKAIQARELDLSNLMARASEGGGGVLIGTMAYRADYEKLTGEEKELRRTAAEKNCALPPPAPAIAPSPAAYIPPTAPAGRPVFQSDQVIH
jgi:hypothetical protein